MDGKILPARQLDDMASRFQKLPPKASLRRHRLEYEELKYRLLAFLVLSENKLKEWTVKYGKKEEVEPLLTDYNVRNISLVNIFWRPCHIC